MTEGEDQMPSPLLSSVEGEDMTRSQSQPVAMTSVASSLASAGSEPSGRWRKRPIVVDAVQVTAADFNGHTWDGSPFSAGPDWLLDALKAGVITPDTPNHTDYAEWRIKTLEGVMLATPGDWIIQGVKGELYPCKPDIFAATYEPALALSAPPATPWMAIEGTRSQSQPSGLDASRHSSGLDAERAAIGEMARAWALSYPEASDGRNTFVLFAEWVERRP